MKNDLIQKKKAVVISVTMGRRLLGTFLTIFFPTILLNVIGYATNFFKEFFFEVSLTFWLDTIINHTNLGSDYGEFDLHVGAYNHVYQRE